MQFLFYPCPHKFRALESAAGSQCLWCLHVSVILSQICGCTTAGRYSLSGEEGEGENWNFRTLCGIRAVSPPLLFPAK